MRKSKRQGMNPNRINKAVGEYFKNQRIRSDLTQEEVSAEWGITNQFICNIENGRASAPHWLIRKMIAKYSLSADKTIKFLVKVYRTELAATIGSR